MVVYAVQRGDGREDLGMADRVGCSRMANTAFGPIERLGAAAA